MAAYNIYEAKSQLSALVERANAGEEVIIARAGKPVAKLVSLRDEAPREKRTFSGKQLLEITSISDEFDRPMTDAELTEWRL